jgi:anti-sigma B factor antagonist
MFDVEEKAGKKIVYIKGEVNGETGLELKNNVLEIFKQIDTVILSFKNVIYMNSSGLREIIDLLKRSKRDKKELRLCEMSGDIRDMFSFTGLDKVFQIFDSESAALR